MPLRDRPGHTNTNEAAIAAIVNRGGSVAVTDAPEVSKTMLLQLRLGSRTVDRIDRLLEKHDPKPSRHFWIVSAIMQKLEAEERSA